LKTYVKLFCCFALKGLRLTHQPSPWIGDYGNFLIKAYFPKSLSGSADDYVGYSPSKSTFSPYYFKTNLLAFSTADEVTTMEFTPTSHGGIMKVEFPTFDPNIDPETEDVSGFIQTRRIAISLNGNADFSEVISSPLDGTTMISGYSKHNSGGVGGDAAAFAHYFVAAIYSGPDGNKITVFDKNSTFASSQSAHVDFEAVDPLNKVLTVRLATSFISTEQALQNLKSEVFTDVSFDEVKMAAKEEVRHCFNTLGGLLIVLV
jgi:putative alpha-1,2-mannosidase